MARQGMTELLLELVAMEWTDRDGMRHLSINSRVASSRAAASSPSGTWLATSLGITQPVTQWTATFNERDVTGHVRVDGGRAVTHCYHRLHAAPVTPPVTIAGV